MFYGVVATVPTACGIETLTKSFSMDHTILLQQYLPLAVLKPKEIYLLRHFGGVLQQYLPLAVLKHDTVLISLNPKSS